MLEPLRRGITVDGERFLPMRVTIDRQQGANVWLTVALREGQNREVRRALEAVGLVVNRLIRVSYGPFQLGELEPGGVEEVRPKVLREQLGLERPPRPARRCGATVRSSLNRRGASMRTARRGEPSSSAINRPASGSRRSRRG